MTHSNRSGFTMLELMVVIAIIFVLTAIAFPVVNTIRARANKQVALNQLKQLGTAALTYANQHDNSLPAEDASGTDTWQSAAKPESNDAWYNACPRLLGMKGVGDFVANPRDFYTKESILFLPGANYPDSDKKLRDPLFAIAINTKLSRKDEAGGKRKTRLSEITHPARTVLLLEQGLPSEDNTLSVQSKKDYDGSPKGSAKSFVGRYNKQGVLMFLDGHAESVDAKTLLTETGQFPFPQTDVIWTRTPDENPNKDAASAASR